MTTATQYVNNEKIDKAVYAVSGRAFALMVRKARAMFPDDADNQRIFVNLCVEQLFTDMRNM